MTSSNITKPPNEQRQCAFLYLPFEVRYQVYGDMASLSTTTFGSYRGLYLSCKHIQSEMAQESERQLKKNLKAVGKASVAIPELPARFIVHHSFHYMRDIILEIPQQAFQAYNYTPKTGTQNLKALRNFAPLFRLHLDSVTIKISSRVLLFRQKYSELSHMDLRQFLAVTGLDSDSPPNTRRIRYKFNFVKEDYFEQFMAARLRGWRPWTDWNQGQLREITWVKTVDGEEEQSYEWMRRYLRVGLTELWTRRHDLSARERMEARIDATYKGGTLRRVPFGSVMSDEGRVYVEEAIDSGILPASLARELKQP